MDRHPYYYDQDETEEACTSFISDSEERYTYEHHSAGAEEEDAAHDTVTLPRHVVEWLEASFIGYAELVAMMQDDDERLALED